MNNKTYHVFFKNLASPARVQIISKLSENPSSVNELSQKLKIEQSKLSHALASLKKCKVVNVKQKGKQRIYSLNKKTIVPMLKLIDKHAKSFCECGGCNVKGCGKK